jgi:hypothetical protein
MKTAERFVGLSGIPRDLLGPVPGYRALEEPAGWAKGNGTRQSPGRIALDDTRNVT